MANFKIMDNTISNRFLAQKELFDSNNYFKLICGAGNEDLEEVRRLSMIYTLSGASGMDISATPSVVKACMEGIDRAYEISHKLKKEIKIRPFIMVSVGMPGDHHVRKALIDPDLCIMCGLCVDPVCPTDAIEWGGAKTLAVVNQPKCIGCGDCSAICPKPEVISYVHNGKGLEEILPECIELGAENIELHAAVAEDEVIMKEWEVVIKSNPLNFNSMCLDRLHMGNFGLESRIRKAKEYSGEKLIIQADGYPMSGGEDNYNTTLQAVATADVINKAFNMELSRRKKKVVYKKNREVTITTSGGTNSLTLDLAKQSGVNIQGVCIGTFARNIIYKNIKEIYDYDDSSFWKDLDNINDACEISTNLIKSNLN